MVLIKLNGFVYAFCLKLIFIKGKALPISKALVLHKTQDVQGGQTIDKSNDQTLNDNTAKILPEDSEELHSYGENTFFGTDDKCAILVMSNRGHTTMQQSLIRKYRYNENGDLIPGSVQYFMKLPKSKEADAVLVPLKNKAFSPSGGFVRYYKEVPPIPQSWRT